MLGSALSAVLIALLAGTSTAHPGHDVATEAKKRAAFLSAIEKTDTSHCGEELAASGHVERLIKRRAETVKLLRREYKLDHSSWLSS